MPRGMRLSLIACPENNRMRRIAFLSIAGVLLASAFGAEKPQPIPFSHRAHAALGLKCRECHAMAGRGWVAGLPAESKCMACHIAVKIESPAIRKLAAYQNEGRPLPWERIYQLPNYVYFSHKRHHEKGGVACETCHGPVAERDVLSKEKSTAMADCMACHEKAAASKECDTCHA
jgi:hypothetical protein